MHHVRIAENFKTGTDCPAVTPSRETQREKAILPDFQPGLRSALIWALPQPFPTRANNNCSGILSWGCELSDFPIMWCPGAK